MAARAERVAREAAVAVANAPATSIAASASSPSTVTSAMPRLARLRGATLLHATAGQHGIGGVSADGIGHAVRRDAGMRGHPHARDAALVRSVGHERIAE